jgi:uncharacterized membrane protein
MSSSSELCDSPVSAKVQLFEIAGIPPAAIAFLVLSSATSLLWSYCRLIWGDEFFVLWTDSASSIGEVVHIQRTFPISLDPLAYHAMAHAAIRLFGCGAFALRLPSLLGFLLMQICLFVFVRRIAGERAGACALAFPAFSGAFSYAVDGRPYGLLLGLFGLAMVSWQAATRRDTKRTVALITLAVAIALALNAHYFGVLLLVPLGAAECFRTFQRRRLDFPVLASIGAGAAGILCVLPFLKAAAEYRANYYGQGHIDPRKIGSALVETLTSISLSDREEAVFLVFLAISASMVLWSCICQVRGGTVQLPGCELVFLIVLAALPFSGYVLARLGSHVFEGRYVLGAVIGMAALLAIGLSPLVRRERVWNDLLIVLFSSVAFSGVAHIVMAHIQAKGVLSALNVTPEIKTAILASPDNRLYIQHLGLFEFASYYEPDPDIRSRMTLVYSKDQEIRWSQMDMTSLIARHMRNFTQFHIASYESLTTQPGDHIFVNYRGLSWSWSDQAFTAAHAKVRLIGKAFAGDVVAVRFLP